MSFKFKTPALGENVKSGKIAKIMVQPGDVVNPDQALFELETDKAVIEIPATMHARISELLVREGDEVQLAQPLLIYEPAADIVAPKVVTKPTELPAPVRELTPASITESEPAPPTPPPASTTGQLVPIQLPGLGENIKGGLIVRILVRIGEVVKSNQGLLELETDKAVIEVPAEIAGTIREILVAVGDQLKVGQKIATIETTATALAEATALAPQPGHPTPPALRPAELPAATSALSIPPSVPAAVPGTSAVLVPASPAVRRFAREIGINVNAVPGTGIRGRISIEDVKNYSKFLNQQKSTSAVLPGGIEAEKLPDFAQWGEIERQTMNKVRQTTARHLSYAWATIPQVTQFDNADITELEKLRQQYAPKVEAAGGKLTITAILLKIVASALKKFLQFNASIDLAKNEIIYKKYYNIGVAVDTERGLLVPVVFKVDQKNITELAVELTQLSEKARQRKLALSEMQGGNFSVSNLGGIGGTAFSPIVNAPEVAILGISRSHLEGVYLDGQFTPRLMLPLSLSYDHRLIDGADGARFLRWIITALEQPFKMLLEG